MHKHQLIALMVSLLLLLSSCDKAAPTPIATLQTSATNPPQAPEIKPPPATSENLPGPAKATGPASQTPESLKGLINAEKAGAMGYSFDGYNALAMSGARIDPAYYLAQCPSPDATTQGILGSMSAYSCGPAGKWDQFVGHVDQTITTSGDGLWQPLTDARIRAVMPMAGEGWWLFLGRGYIISENGFFLWVRVLGGVVTYRRLCYG